MAGVSKTFVSLSLLLYVVVRGDDFSCTKRLGSKLICYYGDVDGVDVDGCRCTHVVLPQKTRVEVLDGLKKRIGGSKLVLTVEEFNEDIVDAIKSSKIDGLELKLRKLTSKSDISDFVSTIRSKLGTDLFLALSVPPKTETVAKYYDLKALSKQVDVFVLQTAFLGASSNVTFHPSRLSGIWDMQNTDSVVDLITGLGAPPSKLIITAPVQGYKFTLQDNQITAPGSPALEVKSLTRDELCKTMKDGKNWTLERDQDQAGPYIFRDKHWISFDDPTSIDIKAKYSRVRGLAGLALKDLSQDGGSDCGPTILQSAYNGLSKQGRAPRAAVLNSLEREILDTPQRPLDTIQVSPYRVTRIIDVEGNVHVVRQDTRTEFECSRQGYFVHPRSCGRFYRCVKFDQLSDEFNVFEFDCPAGLTFDNTVEVCVWPGSLTHSSACAGSSEIAPVPRQRFVCPSEPGYYADPENCRWFFACLDHGKSPLSAYEFRCPFGLVFDESRLLCEWPWLVSRCANEGDAFGKVVQTYEYDGLGVLGATQLGGLSGDIRRPVEKIYSNVGEVEGIGQSDQFLGVQPNVDLGPGQYVNDGHFGVKYINHGTYNRISPVTDNVNIVGGGFSAVGVVKDLQPQVEAGSNIDAISTLSEAVPVVPSVPKLEFESYRSGGVIANLPQLQYKVDSGYYQPNIVSNLVNETLFVNYVSSTPAPSTGYQNADVAFVQGPVRIVSSTPAPFLIENPISFQDIQRPIKVVSSTPTPFVKDFSERPIVTSIDNKVAFGGGVKVVSSTPSPFVVETNYNSQDYSRNQQDLSYVQQPLIISSPRPFSIQGHTEYKSQEFSYSNAVFKSPAPTFADVIRPTINYQNQNSFGQSKVTPGVSYYSYSTSESPLPAAKVQFVQQSSGDVSKSYANQGLTEIGVRYNQEQQVGYDYPKPSVKFEEGPSSTVRPVQQTVSVGYDYPKPSVQFVEGPSSTVRPAVTYSQVNVDHSQKIDIGYDYPKPSVKLEEIPSSTIKPIATYQEVKIDQSVSVGYDYPKPSVQFIEGPSSTVRPVVTYSQVNVDHSQQVDVGYDYPKPSVKFEIPSSTLKPVVTYHEVKIDQTPVQPINLGYNYPKPSVQFVEGPSSTVRPAVTYSQVNVDHSQQVNVGYEYRKPVVKFQEIPSSTLKPYHEVKVDHRPIQPVSVGYDYPKPSIKFVEGPSSTVRPAVTYSQVNVDHSQHQHVNVGYDYPKPVVKLEEIPSSTIKPIATYHEVRIEQPINVGYDYPKPSVQFAEGPSTVKPAVTYSQVNVDHSQVQKVGYDYPKPAIKFEIPSSTVKPAVTYHEVKIDQTPVQAVTVKPAVTYSQIQPVRYDYPKQSIQFVGGPSTVKPAVTYSQVNVDHSVVQQVGYDYPKPVIKFEIPSSTIKPAVTYSQIQPVRYDYSKPVSTYNEINVKVDETPIEAVSVGYDYPKSATPSSASSYSYENKHENYQNIKVEALAPVQSHDYPKPTIATTYSQEAKSEGYVYEKPAINFEEVRPVVATYSTPKPYNYEQPATKLEEARPFVVSTPKPVVTESYVYQPATNYNYQNRHEQRYEVKGQEFGQQGYVYEKPEIKLEDARSLAPTSGYVYEKPSVKFQEGKVNPGTSYSYQNRHETRYQYQQPIVVSSTVRPVEITEGYRLEEAKPLAPVIVEGYTYNKGNQDSGYVYEKPKPYVSTESYVYNQQGYSSYQNATISNQYAKPTVFYQSQPQPIGYEYNQSKQPVRYLKPIVVSTTSSPTYQKELVVEADRFAGQQEVVGYEYPKPQVAFEYENQEPVYEEPFVAKKAYVTGNEDFGYKQEDISYSTSPRVVEYSSEAPKVYSTTYKPSVRYTSTIPSVRYQENYVSSTPKPTFQSTVGTLVTKKVESRPIVRYEFSSLDDVYQQKVSVPSTTYAPTTSRTYLPPSSTTQRDEPQRPALKSTIEAIVTKKLKPYYQSTSSYGQKVTPSLVTTQSVRTYLPPETTSVPTTVKYVEEYVAPGYEVSTLRNTYLPVKVKVTPKVTTIVKQNDFHPMLSAKLGAQCTCSSNQGSRLRNQEEKLLIEVEDESRGESVENYEYEPQKIEEVSPPSKVVVIKKKLRVRPTTTEEPEPSDKELADVVRKGLKLIKSAAKEGAKEAIEDNEIRKRLRADVECQRAGLFRHPNQCNKFYSCRWDCDKKKFVLHTFNCPVHLTFDANLGACNWPSQGPACLEGTLLPSD